MMRATKWVLTCLIVAVCSSSALSQEQIKIKLANGSYMEVDEASETPQGVWYRKGNMSNLIPKEKVKKIERTTPPPPE
ncbi:MAG TPA: hypothetical protein VM656_13455, partial [Pyrinomonadaceae bacterium]|nr:hypothetical protein [Pyrinomonadaceae bacterium]